MKYLYKDNGNQQKVKDDKDFNTNPFKVALTARVGYGWLNFFATYSLTPLFESGRGPELYPVSVACVLGKTKCVQCGSAKRNFKKCEGSAFSFPSVTCLNSKTRSI